MSMCVLKSSLLMILKTVDIARSCAKDDPGRWDAVLKDMPCVKALLADVVAASLEPENTHVMEISFDIRPSGSEQAQDSQRTTPSRNARLRRRVIIAGLNVDRGIQPPNADESTAPRSQEFPDAQPSDDPLVSSTRVVKHASPSYKREATRRPKWQPTTCTAPGVTCGNAGQGGPVSKNEMSDSSCDPEAPSMRLALREARPSPKLPKRFPLLCTSFGIFCEDSDTSDDGSQNIDPGRPSDPTAKGGSQLSSNLPKWSPVLCTSFGIACRDSGFSKDGSENAGTSQTSRFTAKREAQPSPKVPKWSPLLCTARGITCAALNTSDHGPENDHENQPGDSTAKREARPAPMAEARPAPQKGPPKWKPTTCTVPGLTCGALDGVGVGASADNIAADGAKSATEQPRTGEHNKKREPDVAEQFWSGPGRSIFTDDEGNVVQIEDVEGSAT